MFWGSMDSCMASAQCAAPCVSSTRKKRPSEYAPSDMTYTHEHNTQWEMGDSALLLLDR